VVAKKAIKKAVVKKTVKKVAKKVIAKKPVARVKTAAKKMVKAARKQVRRAIKQVKSSPLISEKAPALIHNLTQSVSDFVQTTKHDVLEKINPHTPSEEKGEIDKDPTATPSNYSNSVNTPANDDDNDGEDISRLHDEEE
jgi:Glu-tRNA(Gln) amidotransferase subunit E-like FAD-binding protein